MMIDWLDAKRERTGEHAKERTAENDLKRINNKNVNLKKWDPEFKGFKTLLVQHRQD